MKISKASNTPRKLRSVFKSFGVTSSLMKIYIFHGGAMFIDGASAWAVDLVQPGQQVGLLLPDEPALILISHLVMNHLKLLLKMKIFW